MYYHILLWSDFSIQVMSFCLFVWRKLNDSVLLLPNEVTTYSYQYRTWVGLSLSRGAIYFHEIHLLTRSHLLFVCRDLVISGVIFCGDFV